MQNAKCKLQIANCLPLIPDPEFIPRPFVLILALSRGRGQLRQRDPRCVGDALSAENAVEVWNRALSRLSGMIVDQAGHFDSVAISAPNRLVIRFKSGYAVFKSACERPDQVARFEQALGDVTGQPIRVEFALADDSPNETQPQARVIPAHQRLLEAAKHPLVRRAGELFGAQPVRVDPPDNTARN